MMNKGKKIGYIRVSTVDQNPDRQLEGIVIDKSFVEYASGRTVHRPKLRELINYVREDDVLYVHSLDRLARNSKDLRSLVEGFVSSGVEVHFIKEGLTFTCVNSPISNLMLSLLGAIAEFEIDLMRERQLEGIALAKAAGKYVGRKKSLDNNKIELLRSALANRQSKSSIARDLGISRKTLYNYIGHLETA